MMKIAICDDDIAFTGTLENMVMQVEGFMGIHMETEVFFDGDTFVKRFQGGSRYDLIFLDIEMKTMNGIAVARSIRKLDKSVLLIYVSGYDHYLKELFEVEPFRFLSKPIDKNLFYHYFHDVCQRVIETEKYYEYKYNKEVIKVLINDIVYFESRNRVIYIFFKNGFIQKFYGKLNNVEKKLVEGNKFFLRIHQSFLVNYDYVRKINFSNMVLSFGDGKETTLKISEDRQKEVRAQLCKTIVKKVIMK